MKLYREGFVQKEGRDFLFFCSEVCSGKWAQQAIAADPVGGTPINTKSKDMKPEGMKPIGTKPERKVEDSKSKGMRYVKCGHCTKIAQSSFQVLIPHLEIEIDACSNECLREIRKKNRVCICGKNAQMKCARCGDSFYCDKDCFKNDWQEHKKGCEKKLVSP